MGYKELKTKTNETYFLADCDVVKSLLLDIKRPYGYKLEASDYRSLPALLKMWRERI